MRKRLYKSFGEAVSCRFVDVASPDLAHYPHIKQRLGRQEAALPLVAIGGVIRYSGVFSPTFIHRDVEQLLGQRNSKQERAQKEKAVARSTRSSAWLGRGGWAGSNVSGRPHFATSVHRRP